jgi:hypothetical protein
MSRIAKITAAATLPSVSLPVSVDGEGAAELEALRRQLAPAMQALKEKQESGDARRGSSEAKKLNALMGQIRALEERLADGSFTVKVTAHSSIAWAGLKARHPVPKKGATQVDQSHGADMQATTRAAIKDKGVVVYADGVEETPTEAEWDDLFEAFTGGTMDMLITRVLQLNALDGQAAVRAGKAPSPETRASGKSSTSRSASASRTGA